MWTKNVLALKILHISQEASFIWKYWHFINNQHLCRSKGWSGKKRFHTSVQVIHIQHFLKGNRIFPSNHFRKECLLLHHCRESKWISSLSSYLLLVLGKQVIFSQYSTWSHGIILDVWPQFELEYLSLSKAVVKQEITWWLRSTIAILAFLDPSH